ncbi:PTS system, cellobiose-specific IIB component [Seinonella peptonophila]|uniref:PTS system, cellobiose-specific IIB component n=1 Tax=Seinonella peptonophila TaxID=112248 RepID=A0A1M4V4K2_9BACL|nr:PTS sugar transporter subunit IIB [Seinonella peptonophila]SHE63904.1 PTS system, cellobiose-specific IIB component [Seinonella peptonophila]
MKKVLLICGGGASSGFMAAGIRKAAKKQNVEIEVLARSEAELSELIEDVDILLIGPHLSYMEEEVKKEAENYHAKVAVIPQSIYGRLDGQKALDLIQKLDQSS